MLKKKSQRQSPLQQGTSPVSSLERAPSTAEDYATLVENAWAYVQEGRGGLEYRIKEATHFLAGDQWIRYSPLSNKFTKHVLEDWVPKPITNYLTRPFDRILDLFTSGQIMPHVVPSTQDQADIEASQAAQRILHAEIGRAHV